MVAAIACFVLALPTATANRLQGVPVDGGDIGSLTLNLVRRLDGEKSDREGGVSEFTRFDISISLEPNQEVEPKLVWQSLCLNACQGPPPNHAKHTDCNRLCDRPCDAVHSYEEQKGAVWRTPLQPLQGHDLVESWRLDYGQIMQAVGARGVSWPKFGPVIELVDKFKKDYNKRTVKLNLSHLVSPSEACTGQEYQLYQREYNVVLTVTVELMTAKGGAAPSSAGKLFDRKKVIVGRVTMTDSSQTAAAPFIDCACEKIRRTASAFSSPSVQFGNGFKVLPTETRTASFAGLGKQGFSQAGQYKIAGESMNAVYVSFSGTAARSLLLPAGTRLVPNDPTAQEVVVAENAEIVSSTFGATSISPDEPRRVRVLCAEMSKHEPSPSTKFEVAYPKDPTLSRLAGITANSRFRGPWDQTRLWIYTDDASYDDIYKRLVPPVGKGTYVRLLHDVLSGSLPEPKRKKLTLFLKPEFLSELITDEAAADWAMQTALAQDPKGVIKAVRGRAADWLKDKNFGPNHLVIVLCHLIDSDSQEAQTAAREILLEDVPAENRAELARTAALDRAVTRLASDDEGEVLRWLDVLAAYGIDTAKPWIEMVAKSGKGKAQVRATELLKGGLPPQTRRN